MNGEVSLYGLYVPPLLLLALLAFGVARLLGLLLARAGLYHFIWHPPLFDFSMFIVVLAVLAFFLTRWF